MGELGQRLRAAREAKELGLDRAAEDTRIPVAYLRALEEEAFGAFTGDLHARGFLRNYAAYLGLDPAQAADEYDSLRGKPPARHRLAIPDLPAPGRASSTLAFDALLGLVFVAILAMVGLAWRQSRTAALATPTPGPLPTPTATAVPAVEGTLYTLDVDLDYAGHKLEVRERIDYTNVTSQTLNNLMLNVHPNRVRNAFKLTGIQVEMDGETVQPAVSTLDVTLRVDLPRQLQPGGRLALTLQFTLSLPQIAADAEFSAAGFGYSKRSLSLGNWYPVLAPYRKDKGWYGLSYFPVGDPYVTDAADYRVTVTTTAGVTLAGTGAETRGGDVWRYQADGARSFALAASDRYEVTSQQSGGVAVSVYAFPGRPEAAQAALQTAAQALALFSELFGPYPYADYRIAETEFAGGLEFSGMTFLGAAFLDSYDGTSRHALIPLTAHEVAHQWFYGLVGSDQVTEPWLDEALTQYSSFLFYERTYPADVDWWWLTEVDQYAPSGIIDASIFEFRDNRGYLDAVYRRGAEFVRDLRAAMTDPAFFGFLREYQRRFAYRLAKSKDFFALVREFTTADLVPLQEEYFRQRILP